MEISSRLKTAYINLHTAHNKLTNKNTIIKALYMTSIQYTQRDTVLLVLLFPDELNEPVNFKVKVTLRSTISRPVRLGVRSPSGTHDQFFFLLEIFFWTVAVCYFVVPSLTRGWVCNLLLLLVLTIAVTLGSALSDERSGLSFVSISL
jgi:hypothetical protein